MSVGVTSPTASESLPNNAAERPIRYKFNITEENRTKRAIISLDKYLREQIEQKALRPQQWRSYSQFVMDALIYYLDGGETDESVSEVLAQYDWKSSIHSTGNITPTLFNEVEAMAYHPHTEWSTKQEFYICAIHTYIENDMPWVTPR